MKPSLFLRRFFALALFVVAVVLPSQASAEVQLAKTDTWEVFTSGRAGGFLSNWFGQTLPTSPPLDRPAVGGLDALTEVDQSKEQGNLRGQRVRSGFVGSVLSFGLRRALTEWTKATAYFETWSYIENDSRRKNAEIPVQMRQAYMQLEGPWGTFTVGRQHALFSRGATDINYLYGHTYGVGYPGNVDGNGPTNGHIGFGVIAHGFSPGFVYATPVVSGFQLTLGIFDPSRLDGQFDRTSLVRPEAELTFEHLLGANAKVFLFGNGAFERLYKLGQKTSVDAWGLGYGGRLEIGPVHLGVAGHFGKVFGLNYAFEWSLAGYGVDLDGNPYLRTLDGYYLQSQVILSNRWDVSLGWGATRVHQSPNDVVLDANGKYRYSLLKQQVGYSAGVVYHAADFLHFNLDYFRADFQWFGADPADNVPVDSFGKIVKTVVGLPVGYGERQVVNFVNLGATMTW